MLQLAWPFKNFVDPYETVFRIVDGDTFILENNKQAVRLFGIDALGAGQLLRTRKLCPISELLEKGKVQLKEPMVDNGRIVSFGLCVNGLLINETMIKEGFAALPSEPEREKP